MFKVLIIDVDGIMTDATKIYDKEMQIAYKQFNDYDTTAIKKFKEHGVDVVFLTADNFNLALGDRRRVDTYCVPKNNATVTKLTLFYDICTNHKVKPCDVAYIGDDILDIPVLHSAGYSYAPDTAVHAVKNAAKKIIHTHGGNGVLYSLYEKYKQTMDNRTDTKNINILRYLCATSICKANSGHPGMALGAAPIMYALFKYGMTQTHDPHWTNRDRLVLSAGHGSILLYWALHLFGHNIPRNECLMKFRSNDGVLSGHPERNPYYGIDVTTGTLGQGFANAVGMAIAAKHMGAKHTKNGFNPYDHKVYTILGDGCMMEGITFESASLAGSLNLDNLVAIYDRNRITIDGDIDGVMNDDIQQRFHSMGWCVVEAGNVDKDISKLKSNLIGFIGKNQYKPTLIICDTTIGYGLEDQGHKGTHCGSIDEEELLAMSQKYGFYGTANSIADDGMDMFREKIEESNIKQRAWDTSTSYGYPLSIVRPDRDKDFVPYFSNDDTFENDTTRQVNGTIIEAMGHIQQCFLGGSADLSLTTRISDLDTCFNKDNKSHHICFGAREAAMAAICNGISAYGPFSQGYCSTFLVFSDHMMPAIRLAAMSKLRTLFVFTHDALSGAMDGPTHQSIEHLSNLRNIPNLKVFRPANRKEVVSAHKEAQRHDGPSAMIVSGRKVNNDCEQKAHIGSTDFVLISSGYDLENTIKAADLIYQEHGLIGRVRSAPEMKSFIESYEFSKKTVYIVVESTSNVTIPSNVYHIGIKDFGPHGSMDHLLEHHGLTPERIAKQVIDILLEHYK